MSAGIVRASGLWVSCGTLGQLRNTGSAAEHWVGHSALVSESRPSAFELTHVGCGTLGRPQCTGSAAEHWVGHSALVSESRPSALELTRVGWGGSGRVRQ